MNNIEVNGKILKEERMNWFLDIDAVYTPNPTNANTFRGEVLSKLFPVGNQGGFRYKGESDNPNFIVMYTSGEDVLWRDKIDNSIGVLLYHGDNKTPGTDLHNTKLKGNKILRIIFELASLENTKDRKRIPPIFVFKKSANRDMQFLGLAVPGIQNKPHTEWLLASWGTDRSGLRYQNYKAFFTILDTSDGCEAYPKRASINLNWINEILDGNSFGGRFAPYAWKRYISNKTFKPLIARAEKYAKSKEEQLPADQDGLEILETIHRHFIDIDRGYSFEKFACDLLQKMDESIDYIDVTPSYRDGGIDGIGKYIVFKNSDNPVSVEFYMQAKCYKPDRALGVKDTARVLSRIKNRQFGILVTTSFIGPQAYQEVIDDHHPIVFITGKNIVDFLRDRMELITSDHVKKWILSEYSVSSKK